MSLEPAQCKNCGLRLPRIAIRKREWVCRQCGSKLKKGRWLDYLILSTLVVLFFTWISVGSIAVVYFLDEVLGVESGWVYAAGILSPIALFFAVYALIYPYLSFYKVVETHPHCTKCMYRVEENAESCPECGEVIPWNHALPEAWKAIRWGVSQCNCCGVRVPRSAFVEKTGEWVCRGCGCTLMQPQHIYAACNSILALLMLVFGVAVGVFAAIKVQDVSETIPPIVVFLLGLALGASLVGAVYLMVYPLISPYIVKDARVHCRDCSVAVPEQMDHCPVCNKSVRYPNKIERVNAGV